MARPDGGVRREEYRHFQSITTRWMDNDVYGHVNNVQYYSFFDTAVNQYLIRSGALDIEKSAVIGLVVETSCSYAAPLSFPGVLDAALRVARIGNSSVRYELAIFERSKPHASATGHFIHVYVDRVSRRATALPDSLRMALEAIAVA